MFGGLGKLAGSMGAKVGKNIKGAMTGKGGVNAGPSQGFMSRFKSAAPQALNNAAQMWGGQMAPAARMTGGMMRPPQQPTQNTGVVGPINTAPSGMMPGMPPPQEMYPGMENGGFTGGLPPGITEKMGGNTGISGGLFGRPRLDPTTGQWSSGNSGFGGGMGSIFSRIYGNMGSEIPGRQNIY